MADASDHAAAAGGDQRKRRKKIVACPSMVRDGGAEQNPRYTAFAASHPEVASLIDFAAARDGTRARYGTTHDAEAVKAMESSGAKTEIGMLRSYDDEDVGGNGSGTSACSLAPVGNGWIVAIAASDVLDAAKRIQARIDAGESTSGVTLIGVGGPGTSDEVGGHVQVRVSWHSSAGDLQQVARERIQTIQQEENRSRALPRAPDAVCLPPNFPDKTHSVAEILEQYEDFFQFDGAYYSPMRQWVGKPKDVSSARMTLRLQQYCGAKIKGGEDPNMNMTAMKNAAVEWTKSFVRPGETRSWVELAKKAYNSTSTE
jgi:hypothetical protein